MVAPPLIVLPLLPLTLAFWLACRELFGQAVELSGLGRALRGAAVGFACSPNQRQQPCPLPIQTLALSDAAQLDGEDARAAVLGAGGAGSSAEARRSQAKQVWWCRGD